MIYFNFSFIVLPIVTMQFVIVLINKHNDDDDCYWDQYWDDCRILVPNRFKSRRYQVILVTMSHLLATMYAGIRSINVRNYFWNRNPPKPVIGPTKYHAKYIYELTLYRTYSQNFRSAHVSTLVTTCLRAKLKVTLLQVESSVCKNLLCIKYDTKKST